MVIGCVAESLSVFSLQTSDKVSVRMWNVYGKHILEVGEEDNPHKQDI